MISAGITALKDLSQLGVRSRDLLRLLAYSLCFALFEGMGIGLLLPILQYAERGTAHPDASYRFLAQLLAVLSLRDSPFALPILLLLAFVPIVLRTALQFVRDHKAASIRFLRSL